MIDMPDADSLMAGELGDWLRDQRVLRDDARAQSSKRRWTALFVLLPLFAMLWIAAPIPWEVKGFATFFLGIGALAWVQAPIAKAKRVVKEGINGAIARSLGFEYRCDTGPGPGFEHADGFGLLPAHDRSRFEDLWTGELAGHAFTLHEAHLEKRQKSKNSTSYRKVFRGPVMTLQFGRDFHGTTVVHRAEKSRTFLGGRRESMRRSGQMLDYVDIVHPEFEDALAVYSTDPVEARYLVHPSYVERMIAIERAFQGKDIRTLFHDGRLVIALEARNMFESGSIDEKDDRSRVEKTIAQFGSLARLAHSLNEPAHG